MALPLLAASVSSHLSAVPPPPPLGVSRCAPVLSGTRLRLRARRGTP